MPASPDGCVQIVITDTSSSSATVAIDLTGDSTSSDGDVLLGCDQRLPNEVLVAGIRGFKLKPSMGTKQNL